MKLEVMYRLTNGDSTAEIGPFKVEAPSFAAAPLKYFGELHSKGKKLLLKAMTKPVAP